MVNSAGTVIEIDSDNYIYDLRSGQTIYESTLTGGSASNISGLTCQIVIENVTYPNLQNTAPDITALLNTMTAIQTSISNILSTISSIELNISTLESRVAALETGTPTPDPEPEPTTGITGNVYNDTNDNGMLDSGESGVSGRTVITVNLADFEDTNRTTTDSNGDYSFELDAGTYLVQVEGTDSFAYVTVTDGSTTVQNLGL